MVVLIVVAVACFLAGAASRWPPPLADGPVGSIAFFVVCGLAGAALVLIGIDTDSMVRGLERESFGGLGNAWVVGNYLLVVLRDAGTLAGLALIAYLLSPRPKPGSAPHVPAAARQVPS
jgi:hypothetical protein